MYCSVILTVECTWPKSSVRYTAVTLENKFFLNKNALLINCLCNYLIPNSSTFLLLCVLFFPYITNTYTRIMVPFKVMENSLN